MDFSELLSNSVEKNTGISVVIVFVNYKTVIDHETMDVVIFLLLYVVGGLGYLMLMMFWRVWILKELPLVLDCAGLEN